MILKELDKNIIVDEFRKNASASEMYFLSSLLVVENLSLPEDWTGRIYTSRFIADILLKTKPGFPSKCLRILKPSATNKFKSKEKVIWITMFEPEEIKSSVMFHFDDTMNAYLYVKAFNDINSCYGNEQFMRFVEKGISYVYLDTTLSRSNPYISTENTIEEIKKIYRSHPLFQFGLVLPNYGYEKLIVELAKEFPRLVFPKKTQKYIIDRLGYKDCFCNNLETFTFATLLPGDVNTEDLESQVIIIYITVGEASISDNAYHVYIRQWSPLLSLMDQQMLLETIKPKYLIPIDIDPLVENINLPFSLLWFVKEKPKPKFIENISDESAFDTSSAETSTRNIEIIELDERKTDKSSLVSTKLFEPLPKGSKKAKTFAKTATQNIEMSEPDERKPDNSSLATTLLFEPMPKNRRNAKKSVKDDEVPISDRVDVPSTQRSTNLVKQRTRVVKCNDFVFTDSSESFEIEKCK